LLRQSGRQHGQQQQQQQVSTHLGADCSSMSVKRDGRRRHGLTLNGAAAHAYCGANVITSSN